MSEFWWGMLVFILYIPLIFLWGFTLFDLFARRDLHGWAKASVGGGHPLPSSHWHAHLLHRPAEAGRLVRAQ